jgi:hypothetical protein
VKFKTTLFLLAVLAALLVLVLFILPKKPAEETAKGPQLTDLKQEDVERIVINTGLETIGFKKDAQGKWLISEPLQAKAESFEVDSLAGDFAALRAERVVEEKVQDPTRYGIPKKEIKLWFKGRAEPVHFLLGNENPVDNTLYAQKKGESRIVLLAGAIKSDLDKKLFDYRQKDVFSLETNRVQKIALRFHKEQWQASKKDESWFLEKPVAGLADTFKLDGVINALSGMRAVEFVSEEKTAQNLKDYGLDKPEVEAALSIPASNQAVVFLLGKKDDKLYATTSLSDKVIRVEPQVLTDLDKKPEDLRERGVDIFNAWEAEGLKVKTAAVDLALSKDKQGAWRFESGGKGEADLSKVESFIRQVDGLSAKEFIDKPGPLASYGLDRPQAEIRIRVKELEDKTREVTVLAGSEDKAKKEIVVRNPRLSYLLRVDSAFLSELPRKATDWEKPKEEKAKGGKER